MQILLFIFTLSITLNVLAEDCAPNNLYDDPSSPLHKIPLYDQDGEGTCYAYTSAQIIDYYHLKKNPKHKLTSALWIAMAHKRRNKKMITRHGPFAALRRNFLANPDGLGYSDINLALKDIRQAGICDQDVVKESLRKFREKASKESIDQKLVSKMNDDELIYFYHLLYTDLAALYDSTPSATEAQKKEAYNLALQKLIDQRIKDIVHPVQEAEAVANLEHFKIKDAVACTQPDQDDESQILYDSLMDVMEQDHFNKELKILKRHVFKDCFQDKSNITELEIPKIDHKGEFWSSNDDIKRHIDRALDKKQEPAAIGMCAQLLDSPDFTPPVKFGMNKKFFNKPRVLQLSKSENVKKCSPHYLMVVGRRKNEAGTCQYMLRNSYGSHFWNEHMSCQCTLEGVDKAFDCSYKTHGDQPVKVLGCWVDSENLAESTFSVTSFK